MFTRNFYRVLLLALLSPTATMALRSPPNRSMFWWIQEIASATSCAPAGQV